MTALEGKALLDHGKAIAKRYAGRLGADIADELSAEAVLRVLGSPPPDGHVEPWLERIYRNLVVDHWRRGHAAASFDDVPEISAAGTPEGDAMRAENRRLVRQSLRSLPRETRRLLLMRFYGDADDQVAAQSFGITATTVRTRIHRALARLREYLANLGAWFPPFWGKLSAQLCTIGVAPAFIAAFIVVGATAANPEPTPVTMVPVAAAHHAPTRSFEAAVVTDGQPRARVRVSGPKRASPPAQPLAVPPPVVEFTDDTTVVGTILQPDGIVIVAEPPRPVLPCLVEAPTTFFVQIEKMLEEGI
jgi:RNA polymerase sigma-70 factor (ECF subfamily)